MVAEIAVYKAVFPVWEQHSAQKPMHSVSGSQITASSVTSFQRLLYGHVTSVWEVVKPLQLDIARDETGCYIVTDVMNFTYGTGQTIDKALWDYSTSLVAEMEILQRDEESLAPSLVGELRLLRSYLQSR